MAINIENNIKPIMNNVLKYFLLFSTFLLLLLFLVKKDENSKPIIKPTNPKRIIYCSFDKFIFNL